MNGNLKTVKHNAELCVVGGGLSGMCAAVEAARHGVKVVLMHDRPVYGGNASSEIRMWICGAHGENNRETGIIEEIALENLYRNPYRRYPMWDCILFELIKREKNITPILNCACSDIETDGNKIRKIYGYQSTTQKWHEVEADYFADCSGDSILAPLSGAEYRYGREGRDEFGESIAPEKADKKTMGMTCLIQARQTGKKHKYIAPSWARKFTREDLPYRIPNMDDPEENYWYMEIGGEQDMIGDTEELRDELIRIAYGIWDYIKNSGEYDADNWELDFVGYLPGKRESRRYVGEYIMNQNDVASEGKFDDIVAYGGWTMDDHHPGGINTHEPPNIFHPAPSPFGIPYRCLYSVNIENLYFAGRNISVTHTAMSATRVMATCALLGQAVGAAAYLAEKYNTTPHGVYAEHIRELQHILTDDGCWLPGLKTELSEITRTAKITAGGENAQKLLNGHERPIGGENNCWTGRAGDSVTFMFDGEKDIKEVRFVFNSDLDRETVGAGKYVKEKSTICNVFLDNPALNVPKTLVKDMDVEIFSNGKWRAVNGVENNHQRLVKLPVGEKAEGMRFTVRATNGNETADIYTIDIR